MGFFYQIVRKTTLLRKVKSRNKPSIFSVLQLRKYRIKLPFFTENFVFMFYRSIGIIKIPSENMYDKAVSSEEDNGHLIAQYGMSARSFS